MTPARGSQDVEDDSGRSMYIIRKPPPAVSSSNIYNHDNCSMDCCDFLILIVHDLIIIFDHLEKMSIGMLASDFAWKLQIRIHSWVDIFKFCLRENWNAVKTHFDTTS